MGSQVTRLCFVNDSRMRLVEDVNPRGPLAGKRAELVPWGKECGPF